MKTEKARPIIRIHAHYNGARPFLETYADMFVLYLQKQQKAKSYFYTFESGKPFHYDLKKRQKEPDCDGS